MADWENMTVAGARAELRTLVDEGHTCPLCKQFAKVYRRKINSTQARALIIIHRQCGTDWAYLPSLRMALAPHHSNEEPKLRYWGLLEERPINRGDGGRAGEWRVTELGQRFVKGEVTVQKYARIYNGHCLGFVGERISIREALGDKFNYDELMVGV